MKFFRKPVSAVIALAVVAASLAGCGGGGGSANGASAGGNDAGGSPASESPASNESASSESAASSESPASEEAPATSSGAASRDNTIIFAMGADPRGLDPAMIDDGESAQVMCNIYEGLTKYASDSTKIEPCLATSWDVSDDGLEYVFHLREGVKFHDGTDFNANAVKASIGRQLPPNDISDMPYAEFTFGYVSSLDVVDDYTVKITLSQPCTPFLANLAMVMAAPIVSPDALAKNNGNLNEDPVGTGPFKFVKWQKSAQVSLARNDEYWGEKPSIENLVVRVIPENSARAAAVMSGEIDIMNYLDASDVEAVKASGVQIYTQPGMNTSYMAFNVTRAPFDNKALREAVVRAINVPEMVESLYLGYAQPAYSVLPDFIPGYAPDVKPPAYDPEKSKELLAQEGASDLSINMICYTNPRTYNSVGSKLAEAVQGYLAKVGVTVNITTYDWTTYKGQVSQGEGDICFYGWGGDNGDADNFMNLLDDENRAMNVSGYHSPAYHELIAKAVAAPNGPDRDKLYQQMEQIVSEDLPWLTLSHSVLLAGYNASVKNFSIHPTQTIYLYTLSK